MKRLPLVAVLAVSLGLSALPAFIISAQAATSRTVTLRSVAAYPQAGAPTTLLGSVSSSPEGSPVDVQELRSGSWTGIGSVSTDADGDYAYTFTPSSGGKKTYRSIARGTTTLAEATSPTTSLSVYYLPATPFDAAPTPTVSGSLTVGSTLTADIGTWSPVPATQYVQWFRDGAPIRAYDRKYRVTTQDFRSRLTVVVAADRSGARTIRESTPGKAIGPGPFTTTRPPEITGQATIGHTVTATISGWNPKPTTVTYQWKRDGAPIAGATTADYTITPDDANTELTVDARGEGDGLIPITRTSGTAPVAGLAPTSDVTFGDLMHPRSTTVLPASEGTFVAGDSPPSWGKDRLTRWDAPGAYTHSLAPKPAGTLYSAFYGYDIAYAPNGAEYVSTNSTFKNADVEFEFTGRTFSIEYRTYEDSDAMVWIDDQPVAASPIIGRDEANGRKTGRYWITVTLPARKTVKVRFAGPYFFTGAHTPASDDVQIKATPPPFTLGVTADSFFEHCYDRACLSRSAAPMLSTLTGFRVWNMAEGSTGYINDGSGLLGKQTGEGRGVAGHLTSPYGSARRLEAIRTAPIDALLVNGTLNDSTAWTPTTHRAALEKFLSDVEAIRPDLPVVIVGVEPVSSYTRYSMSHYRALELNFTGMLGRHRNVVGSIDPFTDPWLTADNEAQYLGADHVHPSGTGQAYYQGRIVAELKKLPVPHAP
jgi:hypothetical protein